MDEVRLVSRLAELTGPLYPAEVTPPAALDQARRLLAEALLNDQSEPMEGPSGPSSVLTSIDTLPLQIVDDLRRVVDDAIPAQRDRSLRIFRRTWPLLATHVSQSVPAWASGWSLELSIGPFESAEGGLVWFDIRRTATPVVLVDSQTERPLIGLPPATLSAVPVHAGVTVLNIPAGSVWFAASLFDARSPAGSFAGLRIRGGTLTLSHAAFVQGNTIRASPGIVATLRLHLDPPERPPRTRHGGDARKVSAEFPEHAIFTLSVGAGGKLIQAAPAALEIYGNRIRLRDLEGAAPRYDSLLARLWFPMPANREAISIDDARSQVFRPSGRAIIQESAWTVPVAFPQSGDPSNLGEAAGVGALALSLEKGLHAILDPAESSKPILLESTFLLAETGQLSVIARSAPTRYRRVLDLWENNARGHSQIELESNDPLVLRFDATMAGGGAEALAISTLDCRAQLDRPVSATGDRVPFASRRATLAVQRLADVTRLALTAPADPAHDPVTGVQTPQPDVPFALSNALARTSAALALQLMGVLNEQNQVDRGTLVLRFALSFLLPSLPDPYAANIARRAPRRQFLSSGELSPWLRPQLAARVQWMTPAQPELSFELGAGAVITPGFLRFDDAPIEREPDLFRRAQSHSGLAEVEALFPRATGQGPELFRLLDVSSRAGLFGVGYSPESPALLFSSAPGGQLLLRGLDLIAPTRNVSAFTLPAFQWEPVYNIPNEDALPFPPRLVSSTDGGPTRFAMPAANLVPVAPLPVLDTFLTEYNRQFDLLLAARFTLPFGMVAVAELRRAFFDPLSSSPHFQSVRPGFPASGLSGGPQLTLVAPVPMLGWVGDHSPGLPGTTVQSNNSTGGGNVLKSGFVDATFNATFAGTMKMVPVRRIDFTGYGATTFSDWRNPGLTGPGVSQVKLEAIVGRTSREVVQVRSRLYPWGAIVVRTITMERTGSGGVFRRDSGWQAASDGDYRLPGCTVHPGIVPRLTGIRRIRDTTNMYERGPVKLTQVVFDADVEIEGVTLGASASRLVPSRDIIGYVQVLPVGGDLLDLDLNDLLIATGPIGGPIDCELNVAQSGLHMRLSRIEVDRTTTLAGNPQFVAVARGSVELPGAGQWTVAYRGPSEAEPHRLEADRPIPLIRANPAGGVIPPYRFADPRELHSPANPDSEYGLLHSTGAQRMFVPQPQVRWSDPTLYGGSMFLFADMYTLAGVVALFPRPDQCHPLPAGSALRITGRRKARLDIPIQAELGLGEFKVGPLERTLSQSAALRVRSRFRAGSTIKLVIDSDQRPDWACTFGPVSVISDIEDLEEMMQVVGHMSSSAEAAPELRDAHMIFGGPLAPVQTIIDFLTDFGLPFPFFVSLTNTTYGFKSGAKYTYPFPGIAELVDKGIKHGPGAMLQLELSAGFGKEGESAGEAVDGAFPEAVKQSTLSSGGWHSYVECSAKVLAKAFTFGEVLTIYLGGALKFEFAGQSDGKAEVTFFWGVSGAVEVEVGILKVGGGRTYSIVFRRMIGEIKVGLGFGSEWEVEGSLLAGLAAVKLSFELLALVEKTTDYHFVGEATLAIDVTLGWVFSKTFEVEFDMNETLAAAAFVAKAALPGVA